MKPEPLTQPRLYSSIRFDWLAVLLLAWPVLGAYADTWAHKHIVDELEDFFTPWHAVLYSGLLVATLFMAGVYLQNRRKGYRWPEALPAGYQLSFIGMILSLIGGAGDGIWHTLFGIEEGLDAGLSPTHLLVGLSMALMASGPLRAAWHRTKPTTLLPALFSLTFTLAMLSVLSLFVHPFVFPFAGADHAPAGTYDLLFNAQALGVVATLIQTTVLMAFILMLIRRWSLPFGSLTLVLTLLGLMLSIVEYEFQLIVPAMIGGLVGDGLIKWLRPGVSRPGSFRQFAFLMPTFLYLAYFLTIALTEGFWWSIHLWTGNVVLAGLVGWALSYLIIPPPIPIQEKT